MKEYKVEIFNLKTNDFKSEDIYKTLEDAQQRFNSMKDDSINNPRYYENSKVELSVYENEDYVECLESFEIV